MGEPHAAPSAAGQCDGGLGQYSTADYEQQLEEVLALQSILGDEVFRVVAADGLPPELLAAASPVASSSGQQQPPGADDGQGDEPGAIDAEALAAVGAREDTCVTLTLEVTQHVDVPPGGITLVLASGGSGAGGEADSSSSGSGGGDASGEATAGALVDGPLVHHLPPARIELLLPHDYPSAQPPRPTIHAMWLTPQHAARLVEGLKQRWAEQGPGVPICYDWADWFKSEALREIGVTEQCPRLVLHDRLVAPGQAGTAAEAQEPCCSASGSGNSGSGGSGNVGAADPAAAAAAASAAAPASTSAAEDGAPDGRQAGRGRRKKAGGRHGEASGASPSAVAATPAAAAAASAAASGSSQAAAAQAAASEQATTSQSAAEPVLVLPADQAAMAIMRYASAREHEEFENAFHTCPICFDTLVGNKFIRLPECGHAFCRGCFGQHCRTLVVDGKVERVDCPEPSCRKAVPPYVLQGVLTQEEFTRWEVLLLQRTLDMMDDAVYCPRCDNLVIEDADHCGQCPTCLLVFCSQCCLPWHPGEPCLGGEARLAAQARRGTGRTRGMSEEEKRARELDLVNQMKSLAVISKNARKCPACDMGIEKSEGCNKMKCGYCGTLFCWRCRKIIAGYDHFGEGRCALFEQAEVDAWNAAMAGGRAHEVLVQGAVVQFLARERAPRVRFTNCVVCGQMNIKADNNNNVRCWSCASHYCYLCRTWLRQKPGLHFGIGAGKCKQHTDN